MQKTIGDDRWRDLVPPNVSAQTVRLFRDMTHCELEDRIGDYRSLLDRIDQVLESVTAPSGQGPTSKINANHPVQDIRKSRIKRLPETIAIAALLIVGSVVVLYFSGGLSLEQNRSSTEIRWEIDGFPRPLFNGESVPLFRQSGSWSPTVEADGSRVLTGTQGATMTVPLLLDQRLNGNGDAKIDNAGNHVRFRIGVSLPNPGTVELEFAVGGTSGEQLATLRLQNGQAEWISGKVTTESSPNSSEDASRTIIELPPAPISDDVVFQRVSVTRYADQFMVAINNDAFPPIVCGDDVAVNVRLHCVTGTTHFGDIDMVAMKPIAAEPVTP